MIDQQADIVWRDGNVPVSRQFNDPYFSIEDGLEETRYVFLKGNDLPERFCDGFHIAELGFGTGLNMFASLMAWRASGLAGPLRFTSFEAYPMRTKDMQRALSGFPEVAEVASEFLSAWDQGQRDISIDGLDARVIIGDVSKTLQEWGGKADTWYLDGFAPKVNSEMWHIDILMEIARKSAQGATAATYSAAGHIRRGLDAAGFDVCRVKGFGSKRHMTRAKLRA